MSVLNNALAYRRAVLGSGPVSKASGAITGDPTIPLFTVAGGEVLITALWLKVTTAIANGNGTLAINNDPSTGTALTNVLVTATDLAGTDTTASSVVGLTNGTTAAPAFLRGGTVYLGAIATTGTINLVGAASVDGAVTVSVMWVPLTDGATLVAA